MNNLKIIGNTSFIGHTGYASHSRNFFTHLNNLIPVRIRNYSYCKDLSYLTKEQLNMIIESAWIDPPGKIGFPFIRTKDDLIVNIVLNETNHYFFYDNYTHPTIAYNVWESTKQPIEFFNRLLEYDQFWCPTQWQAQATIEQGYPQHKIRVVPEAVDSSLFHPLTAYSKMSKRKELCSKYGIPENAFIFMIFGRWDYRKATTEMIQCFNETFKDNKNVYLVISVDNPFSVDGLKTTEERLKHYNLESENIRILHFPETSEYIQWLQTGDIFMSCARSEGWNLPLLEAIACGTPTICSNWSGQLEFASDVSQLVGILNFQTPRNVFNIKEGIDLGLWAEPDFDHLCYTMEKMYSNYSEYLDHAKNKAVPIAEKYTWGNAAKLGEQYIKELVSKKHYQVTENLDGITFKTLFEKDGDKCKLTFSPSKPIKGKLLVRMKDQNGNIKYEPVFSNLKPNMNYWCSPDESLKTIQVEFVDIYNSVLYKVVHTYPDKDMIPPSGVELYQDQYINGEVIVKGKRDCESRYDVLKQVFEKYNRPFTILDIGANFGYYSIRAASEFDCVSVMIEGKKDEGAILKKLCEKNNCSNKLTVLNKYLTLDELKELGKCEHFDVVLALNVIHHFDGNIDEVCEAVLNLGDNVLLELPPIDDPCTCNPQNLTPAFNYLETVKKEKLGEFIRHTSNTYSEIFWIKTPKRKLVWPYFSYEKLFKKKEYDVEKLKNRPTNYISSDFEIKTVFSERKNKTNDWIPGINLVTYAELNGIFPDCNYVIDQIKNRNIITDYKWDGSNHDLVTHNIILSGTSLHLIDYDDDNIIPTDNTDEKHLINIIDTLIDSYYLRGWYKEPEKAVKINLGCGNDIKEGYINIDKYNNIGQVDYQLDLGDLNVFEDNSVDEIYLSHVFEHISLNDMYGILEEWRRVLKHNGRLQLFLPDLEYEVKLWLSTPSERKWMEVHRIFGAQSHPGNTHYSGHSVDSLTYFLDSMNFKVLDCKTGNRGHGHEIQCLALNKKDYVHEYNTSYKVHFVDGPFLEVIGHTFDKSYYQVDFLDPDNESNVHEQILTTNHWTRPHRKYFTNWLVKVRKNGKLVFTHEFDLTGKRVMISFDTKSIGDSIAWIPYVEVFRKKYNCEVYISTFQNYLFYKSYPELNFIEPGTVIKNLYASYSVGCYEGDFNRNKNDWRTVPLQQICADTLGLPYDKEIVPDLCIEPGPRPLEEKYVAISEFSTFQCKFWNLKDGWQNVVDYLNENGYKVMVISKEKTRLKNVIDMTNRPMNETITNISHCEFFMGISAGPSWIAWALKKHVIMISGFSKKDAEFSTNITRIINEDVCHGCFNMVNNNFDRGDWLWCPFNKGTDKQFECTKEISFEMVKEELDKIIKNN